ncbi:MAG: hypothetical protein GY821_10995 [Gammaproteobacteria bacterium]|nr:hypothetical protein [Gammaproteobacteria bacterium]
MLRDLAKPRDPTKSGIYSLGDRIKLCKIPILNKIGGFSSLKCYRSKFYKFCEVFKQILLNRSIAKRNQGKGRGQINRDSQLQESLRIFLAVHLGNKESQLQESLRIFLAVHLLKRKAKGNKDPVAGKSSDIPGCESVERKVAESGERSSSFDGRQFQFWRSGKVALERCREGLFLGLPLKEKFVSGSLNELK